jgi:pimeloyl-ACP methyl ester carboxylesterase
MSRLPALAVFLTLSMPFGVEAREPTLALEPCRLEHPARISAVPAECGKVVVPEDPRKPGGRQIELFVARVPAISLNKAKDPLFLIAGGPGTSTVDLYTSATASFDRVRRNRDIILLDQRGTGGSHRLDCHYDNQDLLTNFSDVSIGPANVKCRDELSKESDLRQYTTSVAVADLDTVRARLGYERINLFGNSYGTRVAQHYARRYPRSTRAVILDGVVDPATVLGPAIAVDAERALERILARCAKDAACHAAFSDPYRDYQDLLKRITADPPRVTVNDTNGKLLEFPFTARHLSAVLRLASYNDDQAALLPLSLHLAQRGGNFTPLANQFRVFARSLEETFAYGMHNAVACSEDTPLIDSAKLDRTALDRTHMGASQVEELIEACKEWPRGVDDADLHAPFTSGAAALLLSGADDPVTPPQYATLAQRAFADSKHVIIAGRGHGQYTAPCVDRVMAKFIEAGTARDLDASCTLKLSPMPFFTTLSGPAP